MLNFKVDKDNRRLKNLVDTELRYITKKLEKDTFTKDDIVNINDSFNDFCKSLNQIDKTINKEVMRVSSEVLTNEKLKEDNKDSSNISSNYIRNVLIALTDRLTKTEDDFYTAVIQLILLVEGLCIIYLKNTGIVDNNVDFKEVEKDYE